MAFIVVIYKPVEYNIRKEFVVIHELLLATLWSEELQTNDMFFVEFLLTI